MSKYIKLIIALLWICIFFIFNKLGFLTSNLDTLTDLLGHFQEYQVPLFVVLSTFRIITFIPSAVFMLLGGVILNPFIALALSILSIVLSESLVYIVSKSLFGVKLQQYLSRKYPNIYNLIQENNSQILLLGVLCPFAPTDAICSLSSSAGIKYFKFIAIVTVANLPMVSLYSFLGNSLLSSSYNIIILIITITVITLFTLRLWKSVNMSIKR